MSSLYIGLRCHSYHTVSYMKESMEQANPSFKPTPNAVFINDGLVCRILVKVTSCMISAMCMGSYCFNAVKQGREYLLIHLCHSPAAIACIQFNAVMLKDTITFTSFVPQGST